MSNPLNSRNFSISKNFRGRPTGTEQAHTEAEDQTGQEATGEQPLEKPTQDTECEYCYLSIFYCMRFRKP